jgi:hypothetical protein
MNRLLVHDNDLITVWVYPDRKMLHHHMKSFCYGEALKEALIKGAEALEHYRATKWLSDNRANGAMVPEDAEWTNKVWFPRTRAAGWKHWSIVQPQKILGQMNIARVVKLYAEQGLNARMFDDPAEAETWLDEQP